MKVPEEHKEWEEQKPNKYKPIIVQIPSGELCKLMPICENTQTIREYIQVKTDERQIYPEIKATDKELKAWLKLYPNQAKPKIIRVKGNDLNPRPI